MLYRRKDDTDLAKDKREVYVWKSDQKGCTFWCPCGTRVCNLWIPPHKVSFDKDGIMHIKNSIGSRAKEGRPKDWCHFFVKHGKYIIAKDARCPGKELDTIT